MQDEIRLLGSAAVAFGSVLALTPVAIRVAERLEFYDHPVGYKAHQRPTPYLGGAAVVLGFVIAALLVGGAAARFGWLFGGVALLWLVGTLDDRVALRPAIRLLATVAVATLLWAADLGWSLFSSELENLVLTNVWVVGLVNAFNLMDNMDGATSTVAAVVAGALGTVATIEDDYVLAALALALSGACLGFLPFNLTAPARIFLGDGGSMPIGLVIAAGVMSSPLNEPHYWAGFITAILLVGLPLLDTALVVISRHRRRVTIISGGRDHLTHRLRAVLPSERAVALALLAAQSALGLVAVALSQADATLVAFAGGVWVLVGVAAIAIMETQMAPVEPELPPPAGFPVAEARQA